MSDLIKAVGLLTKRLKSGERKFGESAGFFFGFFQTEDGGIGRLVDCFVFTSGFTKGSGVGGDVEDVVDDLEGEAEVVPEGGEGG